MAEVMNQGALSQVANPAEAMVPSASGGNSAIGDMFKNLLAGSQQKQSYLEQQQEAYNREMEQYAQMVEQSRTPEANEAATWGGMARAASQVAPTWGNIGAMIGQVGGAYGAGQETQQQNDLKNQASLTKMRQDEVRALESKDQSAALLRAMGGGSKVSQPTIKVVDGKLVAAKWDPLTQSYSTEVLTGSQDQIKARMFQTFYNKAVTAELPNPEEYARAQTDKTLAEFGGTTVKGEANSIPGVKAATPSAIPEMKIAPAAQASRDEEAGRVRKGEVTGELPAWPTLPQETKLSPEDAATVARLQARIAANPQASENDTKTLQGILSGYEKPATTVPGMTYKDKPKRAMEEETGKLAGKALGEEQSNLNIAAESSNQLFGQLDMLKKLYQTPNMPEGQLAKEVQGIRSGLKTIGIDVGPEVGAADLASSISGKMALLTRTAEGKNLMPGAMSDFEQKILRGLVPGLEGTAEGRTALIDLMQNMAKTRMRFAEEANKMATENRGILPPEWNQRKQRLMKEEMARLAQLNSQIATRFQGAK